MAMKTTAQEMNDRWDVKAKVGEDAQDVFVRVLITMDEKIEKLEKIVDALSGLETARGHHAATKE